MTAHIITEKNMDVITYPCSTGERDVFLINI